MDFDGAPDYAAYECKPHNMGAMPIPVFSAVTDFRKPHYQISAVYIEGQNDDSGWFSCIYNTILHCEWNISKKALANGSIVKPWIKLFVL